MNKLTFENQAKIYRDLLKYQGELKNYLDKIYNSALEDEIEEKEIREEKQVPVSHLEVDISYYIQVIKHGSTLDELFDALPEKNSKEFSYTINRLIIELNKEISWIKEILAESDDQDLKKEQNKYEEYVSELLDYRDYEDIEEEEKKENKLVFLMTNEINSYLERDLSSVNPEYYNDFISLLNSIKDGTFRQIKRISASSSALNYSLCEVRKYQTRVFFVKLSDDTYLVSGALVKKYNSNSHYLSFLRQRSDIVKNLDKESIRVALSNPEFMRNELEREESIMAYLKAERRDIFGKSNK